MVVTARTKNISSSDMVSPAPEKNIVEIDEEMDDGHISEEYPEFNEDPEIVDIGKQYIPQTPPLTKEKNKPTYVDRLIEKWGTIIAEL
jgi:hypothetical protein